MALLINHQLLVQSHTKPGMLWAIYTRIRKNTITKAVCMYAGLQLFQLCFMPTDGC
jgi:hypothetical protein